MAPPEPRLALRKIVYGDRVAIDPAIRRRLCCSRHWFPERETFVSEVRRPEGEDFACEVGGSEHRDLHARGRRPERGAEPKTKVGSTNKGGKHVIQ